METFFFRRGHWHDWAATQRTGLAAARRLGDVEAQAHAHRGIGNACIDLGVFDEAQRLPPGFAGCAGVTRGAIFDAVRHSDAATTRAKLRGLDAAAVSPHGSRSG
jgi:hypothetical protein